MPYPSRTAPPTLPVFIGTAKCRQTSGQRQALLTFVAAEYAKGRSLRMLADLTGRSQTAVRRALDQAGVPRRQTGAPRLTDLRD